MASSLSRQEMKRLALVGAQARLEALRSEIATIVRAFPELSRGGRAAAAVADVEAPTARAKRGQKRKRNWNMSAEQKKAVSERMKKYWAGRRKEKPSAKAVKKAG